MPQAQRRDKKPSSSAAAGRATGGSQASLPSRLKEIAPPARSLSQLPLGSHLRVGVLGFVGGLLVGWLLGGLSAEKPVSKTGMGKRLSRYRNKRSR